MLDILLSFFADFFLIYNRDWKKTLIDWLYFFLSCGCGVAAWLLFRLDRPLTTVFAILCCIGAVIFFIRSGKHMRECREERNS